MIHPDSESHAIERGKLIPKSVCWTWCSPGEPTQIALYRDAPIRHWLESGEEIVGCNTGWDALCDMALTPQNIPLWHRAYRAGLVTDALLDCKILDIADGIYGSRDDGDGEAEYGAIFSWSVASCYARARPHEEALEKDDWRKRYGQLDGVPLAYWPQGAIDYARKDAHAHRVIHQWCQQRRQRWVEERGVDPLGHHSIRVAQASLTLTRMSAQGVLTDPQRTEQLHARVEAEVQALRAKLVPLGLVRPDGTKNVKAATTRLVSAFRAKGQHAPLSKAGVKQMSAAKKQHLDTELVWRDLEDACNGISVDKDAAILSGDDALYDYSLYGSAKLLRGRVERAREGFVQRLNTRYDPMKETARTSSTQPDEPLVGEQMHNFNRGKKDEALGLREVFCPLAGNLFLYADGEQAELHSLAELCFKLFGFSRLGELLNAGIDVHWYFAARSLGIEYEYIIQHKDEYAEHRDRAKPLNFGLPGGMGVEKIILYSRKSYGVKFTEDEVKALKKLWLETFPEMRLYFAWISKQCSDDGFTHFHPITGFVRGGCTYTSGANHGFQHLMAYAFKDAMVAVDFDCFEPGSPLWGFREWNEVHDEILMEGNAALCQAAAPRLKAVAEAAFNAWHPNFKTSFDPIICDRWSKKAKPKFKDGVWQRHYFD